MAQLVAQNQPSMSSLFLGASIMVSQFVMIGVAFSVGFLMNITGRKPIFLLGIGILPLRALLYTLTNNPLLFLAIEVLDGVGAGIWGVIGVVTVSDLSRNTGRFNFSIGLMALSQGIGSSSSNVLSGFVVDHFGYSIGFITLAGIAMVGFCFYAFFMPETKPDARLL